MNGASANSKPGGVSSCEPGPYTVAQWPCAMASPISALFHRSLTDCQPWRASADHMTV